MVANLKSVNVVFRLVEAIEQMRYVSVGFSLPVFLYRLELDSVGLIFEQLFGHFLVAETFYFCADGG